MLCVKWGFGILNKVIGEGVPGQVTFEQRGLNLWREKPGGQLGEGRENSTCKGPEEGEPGVIQEEQGPCVWS